MFSNVVTCMKNTYSAMTRVCAHMRVYIHSHTQKKESLEKACALKHILLVEHCGVFCFISLLENAGCGLLVDGAAQNERSPRLKTVM